MLDLSVADYGFLDLCTLGFHDVAVFVSYVQVAAVSNLWSHRFIDFCNSGEPGLTTANTRPMKEKNKNPSKQSVVFTLLSLVTRLLVFVANFTIISNASVDILQNGWPEICCGTVSQQEIK